MSKHTPIPWAEIVEKSDSWNGERQTITIGAGETLIATYQTHFVEYPETDEENAANAAFIVKAVNSHDRLVAFARYVLEMDPDSNAPLFSKARKVLSGL